ncbi:MAG TPA: PRC-barrel domain-containing protein [Geminicoccaceae bacterium]|nr:PRC-barrel domain-containing protein [Geminicoccaceae bacterium]
MRKPILATLSLLALAGAGTGLAQTAAPDAAQAPGTGLALPGATAVPGAGTGPATGDTAVNTMRPAGQPRAAEMYGSFGRLGAEGFTGSVAGGFTSEELAGRRVVDPTGNEIGTVRDLLIDPEDDTVSSVLVDVGGFLGLGGRTVALDIESVQSRPGEEGDLVIPLTRDQIEALPAYEEDGEGWRRVAD